MKPWQKRHFRLLVCGEIPSTEEEAYSVFKYMCKHATREFLPDGRTRIRYGYPSDNSS